MGLPDEIVQVDVLERHLLAGLSPNDYNGTCEDEILYDASFGAMEDSFVKYHIARWILMSILLILAWGVGLLMLLYLPIWIYVCRRDFRSRKLYLAPHAIVYKVFAYGVGKLLFDFIFMFLVYLAPLIIIQVTKPVAFPCFGVLKTEKHVILPFVSDIVVEQGYLQSFLGVYSIRIENIGVRRPASDDIKITGVADSHDFRKAVLFHLLNTRNLDFSRKAFVSDDHQSTSSNPITSSSKMQVRLEGAETSKMKTTSS